VREAPAQGEHAVIDVRVQPFLQRVEAGAPTVQVGSGLLEQIAHHGGMTLQRRIGLAGGRQLFTRQRARGVQQAVARRAFGPGGGLDQFQQRTFQPRAQRIQHDVEQLAAADQPAKPSGQEDQHVQGARAKRRRHAIDEQLPLLHDQLVAVEAQDLGQQWERWGRHRGWFAIVTGSPWSCGRPCDARAIA
jgi:hypothetical protein